MRRPFLLFLLLVALLSCGKREKRHYDGVAVTATGTPVPDATVSLVYRQGAGSISDGFDEVTRLGVTNGDGFFSADFVLRKKEYTIAFIVRSPPPASSYVYIADTIQNSVSGMKIVL